MHEFPLQDDILRDLLATALSVTVQEDRLEQFGIFDLRVLIMHVKEVQDGWADLRRRVLAMDGEEDSSAVNTPSGNPDGSPGSVASMQGFGAAVYILYTLYLACTAHEADAMVLPSSEIASAATCWTITSRLCVCVCVF